MTPATSSHHTLSGVWKRLNAQMRRMSWAIRVCQPGNAPRIEKKGTFPSKQQHSECMSLIEGAIELCLRRRNCQRLCSNRLSVPSKIYKIVRTTTDMSTTWRSWRARLLGLTRVIRCIMYIARGQRSTGTIDTAMKDIVGAGSTGVTRRIRGTRRNRTRSMRGQV